MAADTLNVVLKLGLFATSLVVLYRITKSKVIRKLIFTYLSSKFGGKIIARALEPHKTALFSQLKSITSQDPELATEGPGVLRILEIGIGSGSNLIYYSKGCRLIALEPNKFFEAHFQSNLKQFNHIILEKCVQHPAEDMRTILSESIDIVVSTHVLCSVNNVAMCLEEIHRVLVPGGKFLFIEHTSYDSYQGWGRTFQKLSEPIWSFLSDGCELTRKFSDDLLSTKFSTHQYDKVLVDGVFYVMKPHIIGFLMK